MDKKEIAGLEPTAQNRGVITCIQMVIVQHPLLPLVNLITVKDQIVVLVDSKTKILIKIKEGFQIRIKVLLENQIKEDSEITKNKVVIHKVKVTFNNKTRATFTLKLSLISSSKIKEIFNREAIIGEHIKTITKVPRAKEENYATLDWCVKKKVVDSGTLQVTKEERVAQDQLQCSKISNACKLLKCLKTSAQAIVEKSIY